MHDVGLLEATGVCTDPQHLLVGLRCGVVQWNRWNSQRSGSTSGLALIGAQQAFRLFVLLKTVCLVSFGLMSVPKVLRLGHVLIIAYGT